MINPFIGTHKECLWEWTFTALTATDAYYHHNQLDFIVTEAATAHSLPQVAGQWGHGLAPRDQVDQWEGGARIWGEECVGAPTLPRCSDCQPAVDLGRWKSHLRDLLAFATLHFHQELNLKLKMVRSAFNYYLLRGPLFILSWHYCMHIHSFQTLSLLTFNGLFLCAVLSSS